MISRTSVINFLLIIDASLFAAPASDNCLINEKWPEFSPLFHIIPALEPNWVSYRSQLENYVDIRAQLTVYESWSEYRKIRDQIFEGRVFDEMKSALLHKHIHRKLLQLTEPETYEIIAAIEQLRGNASVAFRSRLTSLRLVSSYRSCSSFRKEFSKIHNATALASFIQFQKEIQRRWQPPPTGKSSLKDCRFLVCQPTFGLGNRINALMMCWALALASRRALLIHWNCMSCESAL
jgi:hypothetical protein